MEQGTGAERIERAIHPNGWAQTGRNAQGRESTVLQIVDDRIITHLEEHARQIDSILR